MSNKEVIKRDNALAIVLLFFFFPVGLYIMWKKTHWNKIIKWIITSVYALFTFIMIAGMSSPSTPTTNTTGSTSSQQTVSVTVTETPEKPKTSEEQLKAIAKETVGDDKADVHQVNGRWVVFASKMDMDFSEPLAFFGAKQITRDFMFKVYATKLPIQSVEIVLHSPADGKYFDAALGHDVAELNSSDTWTNDEIGPSIFYNFLVQHTNSSESTDTNDAGTFVDTNLQ